MPDHRRRSETGLTITMSGAEREELDPYRAPGESWPDFMVSCARRYIATVEAGRRPPPIVPPSEERARRQQSSVDRGGERAYQLAAANARDLGRCSWPGVGRVLSQQEGSTVTRSAAYLRAQRYAEREGLPFPPLDNTDADGAPGEEGRKVTAGA